MPEKFLVIGASSFYGSNFMETVKRRGDFALPMSLRDWSPSFMLDVAPDYIVNFAAANIVAESWDHPAEYCRINVCETADLFDVLKATGWLKKFIHVSTPESYGHTDGWVDETYSNWQPSTPYAVSRAAADMMLMAYHRAYRFPAIITRTANIYGPGQGKNRVIPLAFDTFRRGEKLLLHGNGHTRRSFIHVQDACAALYLLSRHGSVGQTYHISTAHDISINELVRKICRLLGKRPEEHIGSQEDRLGKDHAYLLNSARLRNMGWRDTITIDKGLREYAGT